MKRISFLTLGLLTALPLFCAEDCSDATSGPDARKKYRNEVVQRFYSNQNEQMQQISSIAVKLFQCGMNPQVLKACFSDLCAQPMTQLTLLTLADLLEKSDAQVAQIIRAPFSPRQRRDITTFLGHQASSLFHTLAESEKERGSYELRQTINVMAVASHLRTRLMNRQHMDHVHDGCFMFHFPIVRDDWGKILHICAAVRVCEHEHSCGEWVQDLASNPLAQQIMWSAAMGSLSTAPELAAIVHAVLPDEARIKKADLATALAVTSSDDQYHIWIQRAIADAGSWRSMLDMQQRRPLDEEPSDKHDSAAHIANKKMELYWYAQAQRAGWIADPKMQETINAFYADVDRHEMQERERQQKKQQEAALLLTKSQEKEKATEAELAESVAMVSIDFKRDIEQILHDEIHEGYIPEDDQADQVAREVTEHDITLSNMEAMRKVLENENEASNENAKFILVKLNVKPE